PSGVPLPSWLTFVSVPFVMGLPCPAGWQGPSAELLPRRSGSVQASSWWASEGGRHFRAVIGSQLGCVKLPVTGLPCRGSGVGRAFNGFPNSALHPPSPLPTPPASGRQGP